MSKHVIDHRALNPKKAKIVYNVQNMSQGYSSRLEDRRALIIVVD